MKHSSMWNNLVRTTLRLSLPIALSLLFTFYFLPSTCLASVSEDLMKIGVGARVMGMGKAFVAVADDGNSMFMNPAGLADVKGWQINSMYTNLQEGELPYVVLSGIRPLWNGTCGFGMISTGTGQIIQTGVLGKGYFDYNNSLFFLSYATKIRDNVSLGANLKYFKQGFSGAIAQAGEGYDMDLGVKCDINKKLSVGLNLQNLLPTNIYWAGGAVDEVPMNIKAGVAYKASDSLIAALDFDMVQQVNRPSTSHFGVEWSANQFLTIRGGFDQTVSVSSGVFTNPTAGVGIGYGAFKLEYAYHPYNDGYESSAHFVSIMIASK